MRRRPHGGMTIRFRLGLALALALCPVLALGVLQVVTEFHRDARVRQETLIEAADRAATTARARMQGAVALLQTLNPQVVGMDCTPRLAAALDQLSGYRNLARLDANGRVECAAASVPPGIDRAKLAWFVRLKNGASSVVAKSSSATSPTLIVATRAQKRDDRFDGALVASIDLESLRPDLSDPTLPTGTAVAVLGGDGRYMVQTDPRAFAPLPANWRAVDRNGILFTTKSPTGAMRDIAVAPLLHNEAYVVLSAPAPGLFYWARLNPFSSVVYPVLGWLAAWAAVWVVTERVVVRWLAYLDRIASIYARGRFTVRPVQAESAPREIRDLAHTLDAMADGLVARDQRLKDSLAHKDTLMREIHHRVKNNLQVINSLLNLQQRALTDPAARAAMSDTRQRITALALIYRALYQSPDLRRVDLRQFLEELVGQLSAGEGGKLLPIRTNLHADDLEIDPDQLAPLALFAVEAITNARKHAFDERGGVIEVRFQAGETNAVLEIADNGKGEAGPAASSGVGRTLMSAFARQLRGELEIIQGEEGGVVVRLTFPKPRLRDLDPQGDPTGNQAAA
ncbi:MAG: sensor histidine kinase [Caulobacteraceae bacterium]